jgi:predicted nucleic acid-binding protein
VISALDSSVILDVVVDDVEHAEASARALQRALAEGQLIICECVLAEVRPAFPSDKEFASFLSDWRVEFIPSTRESAMLAGKLFRRHLERGGKRGRVIADFLIGAHASTVADRLVARDRGYLRDYFRRLPVLAPK